MVNVQFCLHRVMPRRFAKHSRSTQELLRFLISCLATFRVHQYLTIIPRARMGSQSIAYVRPHGLLTQRP